MVLQLFFWALLLPVPLGLLFRPLSLLLLFLSSYHPSALVKPPCPQAGKCYITESNLPRRSRLVKDPAIAQGLPRVLLVMHVDNQEWREGTSAADR